MPIVTYRRPNRTLPRPFTIEDVARIYCRLVESGIPDEVIQDAIEDRCGEDREKRREAKERAQAAVQQLLDQGGSIEDAYLGFLRNAADQILQNAEYLNDQISQLERTKRFITVLAPASALLRRFVIGAPFSSALNLLRRQVDGQLAQILPLKARNDAVFEEIGIFISTQELARALGRAVL